MCAVFKENLDKWLYVGVDRETHFVILGLIGSG